MHSNKVIVKENIPTNLITKVMSLIKIPNSIKQRKSLV